MTTAHYRTALVWFRRDLRCFDHTALHTALSQADQVYAVFVFDRDILDALPSRYDRRVEFIWHALRELDTQLRQRGGGLMVLQGKAREEIPRLAAQLGVEAVMTHHDYEPQAIARDAAVAAALQQQGRAWLTFKDTVIFEKTEVLTGAGKPFSVFTPYKNAWLKKLTPAELAPRSCEHGQLAAPLPGYALPDLATLGFEHTNLLELGLHPGMTGAQTLLHEFETRLSAYAERRDFPALKGPSYLSVHLRFGTVSIRQLARLAHAQYLRGDRGAEVWLSELVWRDFYFQILANFPHVVERSFKPDYDRIP
ncbi:MAG: deoxyribodipyrimidine photo-lyase, partial [Burkholderiales bacterium]|nr:deoxyribodipyrimidine photo-lyase [Burkholderiales bacterium]